VKEEDHPLTRTYIFCAKLKARVQELKLKVDEELRSLEKQLSSLREELRGKYGEGYLTIKWVKGKAGKKYRYAIYRVLKPKRRDIYLPKEALTLLERIRELKKKAKELRKAEYMINMYMKALEPYAP